MYTQYGYGQVEMLGKSPQTGQVLSEEEKEQLPEMNMVRLKSGATATLHVNMSITGVEKSAAEYRCNPR